ncbi:Gfo/Idh/MocA family oxidoreductase [Leifsonia sp. F6_8S_P_1B]|uniref:Gfo/Idh/MocA family oxidoreductase n=1 Tax=Leifsonia williamsii TaxID=3035919 RepID=A0ABT8K7E9_9MICO|nr:Gfo/Idh/MocA family oxidoreductase [Leifsonia williamsii]MDN4613368.1 Gfo/Idh/MocA family oxidoreductase [Leifsonia williamsii]
MSHPLAVAAIGFWHVHAGDYARAAEQHPDTALVAVWDDDEQRGRAAAEEFGVEFVADLDELLARPDLDGVTITTSTDVHHDVISRAVAAGKHVFTEKLLAPTVDEAEDLVHRASAAGVALVVSLPRLYDDYTVAIERILDEGSLGDLTYSRVRLAHDGWVAGWLPERFADPAEATGGALTDLGCHPAYLTRLYHRAEPLTVTASYGSVTGRRVEDNAVVTAEFPGGRLGVFEASVVTTPGAFTVELRGTRASVMFGFGGERLLAKGGDFGDEWQEIPLPESRPGAFAQWVQHIHDGTTADDNLEHAVALTRTVVAANASAEAGRAVAWSAATATAPVR